MSSAGYNLPILVVDPEPGQRMALSDLLSRHGQSVDTAPDSASARELLERKVYKLILAESALAAGDGKSLLSEVQRRAAQTPVVLLAQEGDLREAVEAIHQGALDYRIKPLTNEIIQEILAQLAEINRAVAQNQFPVRGGKSRQIVTVSAEMKNLLQMARSVAPSQATVLISGESGTGKELLARHIHAHSDRAEGAFVAVNCAALPENLLESELFGHEKGAFTGAIARKPGKFELADGGTLLLDEVSEMDLALQAKLLRVLQEGEIDRLGGQRPVAVDVRVVATTNRRLEEEVEKGRFREDLYYRLNVIPLRLPSLRERPEDIEPLAEHFLAKYSTKNNRSGITFAPETLDRLKAHSWPGNVRELENIIERAVLLSQSEEIKARDLLLEPKAGPGPARPSGSSYAGQTIREMERDLIESALSRTGGNRTHAAKLLGISVRTLRNKLNEYKQDAVEAERRTALGG